MPSADATTSKPSRSWLLFALVVFLGAFLLFQVQPLVGRRILPWFGGTAAVWATCLVVFQTLLLAGYAWAHWVDRWGVRAQVIAHLLLLALAATVSIVPADSWKPTGEEQPLLHIATLLLASVGLPFFALCATGPLLQAWAWRAERRRSPYPLYAWSNAGSLLALISYPLLFEPLFAGRTQALFWRSAFVLLVGLCAVAGHRVWTARAGVSSFDPGPSGPGAAFVADAHGSRALWIAWSACGVLLFMAVTNQLTLNVASVPFLWVLPLCIYLVTFILAFSGSRMYPRRLSGVLLVAAVAILYGLLRAEVSYSKGVAAAIPLARQVALYAAALFATCFVCHGELHRLRPAPERLTEFYMSIAAGGAIGGFVVAVLAPLAFLLYQELHLGMVACCMLWLLTRISDPQSRVFQKRPRWAAAGASLAVLGLAGLLWHQTHTLIDGARLTQRNFFGVLRVLELGDGPLSNRALALYDGAILHGYQPLHPKLQQRATTYYSPLTGVGRLLRLSRPAGRRVGIVGLGAGTLAAYGGSEDYFRFYEINPDVVAVARREFSFLAGSTAQWEIALGDARLSLEREPSQGFDVLVLDAFSSDSVPVHLLTLEAFDVYDRHLAPSGVIAFHSTNLHLDLSRLVYALGRARGFHTLEVINDEHWEELTLPSRWMLLAREPSVLRELAEELRPLAEAGGLELVPGSDDRYRRVRPWTDEYSNLLQIVR
jgi:hypothetical protein